MHKGNRANGIIRAITNIARIMPRSDYQSLVSHSTKEIENKVKKMTNEQMNYAFKKAKSKIDKNKI